MVYDKHIFVCCNTKADPTKRSCGEAHGLELIKTLQEKIKGAGIKEKIRVNKSGCLGICNLGQTVAIYPEGTFYVNVQNEDADELIAQHLKNNTVVERLLLPTPKQA
jgi:(2Fe-2S) ferredoxin